HKYTIRADAIAMAGDIEREINNGNISPEILNNIINTQTVLRSLTEAALFQPGRLIAQSQLSFSLTFEHVPASDIETAERGDIVVKLEGEDKVRALIKLKTNRIPETYLLIGRLIDNKVVKHMDTADGSVQQYRLLKANIKNKQIEFSIVFIVLALLLLFTAMWYGIYFANRLIQPIAKLINAAERVRAGDFSVKVGEGHKKDEIATLGRAFNRMTGELEKQRNDLVEVTRQLDTRRRFIEAVLSGVSAGIIALTNDKKITLANPVTASLLLLSPDFEIKGRNIIDIIPEFSELFQEAEDKKILLINRDVTIIRLEKTNILHVRLSIERSGNNIDGYIITFDDITELMVAQRRAAWSDVARRVAHEIKNPLTPIQLAAERLRKKYLPQITIDSENYIKYIDTISRHVGDIGKIVEEFSNFARMPAPSMKNEDIIGIIQKAIFSEQTTHSDIRYDVNLPKEVVNILCDEQQINRLLLNLLKNSAESFETSNVSDKKIMIIGALEGNSFIIRIIDNGAGFPADKINRLFEPYMTTRNKGTGLGLSIVKKIVDDHKGLITLENNAEGGACVTMAFEML
ncbi:MAG: ATP-binding protein, partial [Pseudomonadota bacterium]